jgi:hypothetical protein
VLVSCASSGKSLIPTAQAGPLHSDFELVESAARSAHGSCAATEAAVGKTEADFAALPASVDAGLRARLREGIAKLHEDALELCAQPAGQPTSATTTTSTQGTATTPATTPASTAQSAPTTSTSTATPPGGGTPAGEGEGEAGEGEREKGKAKGKDPEGAASGGAPAVGGQGGGK